MPAAHRGPTGRAGPYVRGPPARPTSALSPHPRPAPWGLSTEQRLMAGRVAATSTCCDCTRAGRAHQAEEHVGHRRPRRTGLSCALCAERRCLFLRGLFRRPGLRVVLGVLRVVLGVLRVVLLRGLRLLLRLLRLLRALSLRLRSGRLQAILGLLLSLLGLAHKVPSMRPGLGAPFASTSLDGLLHALEEVLEAVLRVAGEVRGAVHQVLRLPLVLPVLGLVRALAYTAEALGVLQGPCGRGGLARRAPGLPAQAADLLLLLLLGAAESAAHGPRPPRGHLRDLLRRALGGLAVLGDGLGVLRVLERGQVAAEGLVRRLLLCGDLVGHALLDGGRLGLHVCLGSWHGAGEGVQRLHGLRRPVKGVLECEACVLHRLLVGDLGWRRRPAAGH
mmetsp:Transcript_60139/g.173467  ORF Transcript_60139/g.173467 Transcript_60139/m.173467 type:complete len:391 (-) Transcript_60139:122-1294(-)